MRADVTVKAKMSARADVSVTDPRYRTRAALDLLSGRQYGEGPYGPSYPQESVKLEWYYGGSTYREDTGEHLPESVLSRGALADQAVKLERTLRQPKRWTIDFLPPYSEDTMYHAAADYATRRGISVTNMRVEEFREADFS